jgi:hypothetical protein
VLKHFFDRLTFKAFRQRLVDAWQTLLAALKENTATQVVLHDKIDQLIAHAEFGTEATRLQLKQQGLLSVTSREQVGPAVRSNNAP